MQVRSPAVPHALCWHLDNVAYADVHLHSPTEACSAWCEGPGTSCVCSQESATAKRSALRNFLMHGFHVLVMMVVGNQIRDTQCGFKVCTKPTFSKVEGQLAKLGGVCSKL